MPNIEPMELAIVAVIVLIMFGPKRLPEVARGVGDGMREFKSAITGQTAVSPRPSASAPPMANAATATSATDAADPPVTG